MGHLYDLRFQKSFCENFLGGGGVPMSHVDYKNGTVNVDIFRAAKFSCI